MTCKLNDIVAISAVRTPMGKFGGSLKDLSVFHFGAVVIQEALSRAGVKPEEMDDAILGCCRHAGNGTNPGRTATRLAGFPANVPAVTVTMACASGMRAVMMAASGPSARGGPIYRDRRDGEHEHHPLPPHGLAAGRGSEGETRGSLTAGTTAETPSSRTPGQGSPRSFW